ncbi:MAG: Hsp20 family protein [Proteobacteria bacterium]|nr:Hsp20 family protein [Pseudomonadota bacterium]TDI60745.1 MAG: Hsp20 family protein [Alphaproteobacteria bacterium]
MTTLDFSPLFRSTVGFDRLFLFFEDALRRDTAEVGYPPYNIEKTGEDSYRVTMAVAGLGKEDLNVEARANTLVVSAKRREEVADNAYLHRGIAGRGFTRQFRLADHVKVAGADLENGLLHIDLVRELPEEMKPRRIEISTSARKKLFHDNKKKAA